MAVRVTRLVARTAEELSLSRLDQKSIRLYAFLLRKLGYRSSPLPVALSFMVKGTGLSTQQVRSRLFKLVEGRLIQKWTVKHPQHYKKTYYRIVYTGDRRALYRSHSPGTRTIPFKEKGEGSSSIQK